MNKITKYSHILLLFFLLVLVFPFNVLGETKDDSGQIFYSTESDKIICVSGSMYQLYDIGEDVNPASVTSIDLENNCLFDRSTNSCQTGSTQFKKNAMGKSCIITSGAIGASEYLSAICPLKHDFDNLVSVDDLNSQEHFHQNWDPKLNQWKITITDAKGYRVGLANGEKSSKGNMIYSEVCLSYQGNECTSYGLKVEDNHWLSGSNGTFSFYANPGAQYAVAFYFDGGSDNPCDGAYVGYITGVASSWVPNPIRERKICSDFASSIKNNVNKSIAEQYVNECFDEKIDYSLIKDYTDAVIQEDIDRAGKLIDGLSSKTPVTDSLQCYFGDEYNSNINTKEGSSYHESAQEYTHFLEGVGGSYWGARCTEKLVITYEEPKALRAGEGFSYTPVITMTRTCEPVERKRPKMLSLCKYGVECYGGPFDHSGEPCAGPNELFDRCVASCDNGAYSQSCIDQCYASIYQNQINSDAISSANNISIDLYRTTTYLDKNNTTILGNVSAKTYLSENCGTTPKGNPITSCNVITWTCENEICVTDHGVDFSYITGCNGTACYEVRVSGPDCSMDPVADYNKEVDDSYNEYLKVQEAIKQYTGGSIGKEVFTAAIVDSHTQNVITYKNATDKEVKVDKKTYPENNNLEYSLEEAGSYSYTIGGSSGGKSRSFTITKYTSEREYTLNLDQAYVSQVDVGDIRYGKKQFVGNPDLAKYYYDGGNKFYTNINAKGVNLLERWPSVIGWDNKDALINGDFEEQGISQNIYFNFANLGSWGQWSNIDLHCFYGIKDNTGIYLDPGCTACGPNEQNCINTCGLSYIYRPINLNQPFLEEQQEIGRNPRWNWTTSANSLRYNIMPDETRLEIIQKGNTIYETSNQENDPSDELDYEIVLTKQNINAIRQYNREHNGEYLDYDMYCYNDTKLGINVCQSKFLNGGANSDYDLNGTSSYYMELKKRGMVGCNNQKGNVCERKYVDMRGGNQ